ncbi:hypothetical protein E2C01_088902 [Portunus trituberculatus]|uniref:Uncharacterized protein n=1 Tax=Portunus trituberculatus TaxID=210409 RepID=A0A5B7J7E0_PORTR|nr:hypothetical protein [Portunus trituberculatus]
MMRRAMRLVDGIIPQPLQDIFPLDPLEHRGMLELVVFHKAQIQEVPHLARLRLPYWPVERDTRTVSTTDQLVWMARSRSSQHQRTFTARTARLWNLFTVATPDVRQMSTTQVKLAAHRWRTSLLSPWT